MWVLYHWRDIYAYAASLRGVMADSRDEQDKTRRMSSRHVSEVESVPEEKGSGGLSDEHICPKECAREGRFTTGGIYHQNVSYFCNGVDHQR